MQWLAPSDSFLFEDFRLDRRGGLSRRDDSGVFAPVTIGSRALDILGVLIERAGEVVSKDEIIAAVWPGTVVEDSNVTVQISALRRVLDRGRLNGGFIQTVAGRGYRFVASVSHTVADVRQGGLLTNNRTESTKDAVEASLPLPGKPSVAVLPFANMSSDPEQEFLTDGIAEDIITALSRYPSLFVIAHSSSFTYNDRAIDVKQIGRELGVRYVLEGSLRKAGNRIRATAQLVEAETGKHVWAERYDRALADIFAVQDEITEAVTIASAPAIAQAERQRAMREQPENLDAWAACQRGLWHLGKFSAADNALARKFFQQAIALDPNFCRGYSGLSATEWQALTLDVRGSADPKSFAEADERHERLARQAMALDDTDPEARLALAEVRFRRGDYEGVLAETERALAIAPNLAAAHGDRAAALIYSGKPKEGLASLETFFRLDPHSPSLATRLHSAQIAHYFCRDYEASVEAAKRVVWAYPEFANAYRWLAAALGQLDHLEEAKQALEKAKAIALSHFDTRVRQRVPWHRPEDHAHLVEGLRKAGMLEE